MKKCRVLGSIIGAFVIALDQFTKYLATLYLEPIDQAEFLPGILHFRWVTNRGAAWGRFSDNKWVLLGATGLMILALLVASFTKWLKDPPLTFFCLLFAAGGIGNLIDRIRLGYVVDFLKFSFVEFPVFNVADICVTCTVAATLIYFLFFQKEKGEQA